VISAARGAFFRRLRSTRWRLDGTEREGFGKKGRRDARSRSLSPLLQYHHDLTPQYAPCAAHRPGFRCLHPFQLVDELDLDIVVLRDGVQRVVDAAERAAADEDDGEQQQASAEADADVRNGTTLLLTAAAAATALAVLLGWLIVRSIAQPIDRALRVAEAVADGDLTSDIEASGCDELGRLLAALQRMNRSLSTIVTQVRTSSDSIATGSARSPSATPTCRSAPMP